MCLNDFLMVIFIFSEYFGEDDDDSNDENNWRNEYPDDDDANYTEDLDNYYDGFGGGGMKAIKKKLN